MKQLMTMMAHNHIGGHGGHMKQLMTIDKTSMPCDHNVLTYRQQDHGPEQSIGIRLCASRAVEHVERCCNSSSVLHDVLQHMKKDICYNRYCFYIK